MKTSLSIVREFFPNVTHARDARKPITIEVTKNDATISKRRAHRECAMAVACKRAFKVDGVIIARTTAYLVKGTTATRFKLPPSVAREITSFDRGSDFAPGVYTLSKPSESHKMDSPGGNGKRNGKGSSRAHQHLTTGIRAVLGGQDAQV